MRIYGVLQKAALAAATFGLGVTLFLADSAAARRMFAAGPAVTLRVGQRVRIVNDAAGEVWSVAHVPEPTPFGDFVGLRRGEETAVVMPGDVRPVP